MIDLDDEAAIAAADPGRMLEAIVGAPDQCRDGYELGLATSGLPTVDGVTAVAFCGMGGSAIAGDVIRTLFAGRLHAPVVVVRTPALPAFCGPHTLVIASSYSGDTAETLSMFDEAIARRCRAIAVTAGGELARRAADVGAACVRLPATFSMPRAAFGVLTFGPIGALEAAGLLPRLRADVDEAAGALRAVVDAAGPATPTASNPAKALAARIGERIPLVWGAEGIGAVAAARWRSQLNENAKVPAFSSSLPELDHNEVVGWSGDRGRPFFLLALRHDAELPEVAERFPMSIEIARSSGMEVEEIRAHGRSELAMLLTLVLRGDLVATYLAFVRGVDPSPIEAIARLKRALAGAS